jgi:hypothetical protein
MELCAPKLCPSFCLCCAQAVDVVGFSPYTTEYKFNGFLLRRPCQPGPDRQSYSSHDDKHGVQLQATAAEFQLSDQAHQASCVTAGIVSSENPCSIAIVFKPAHGAAKIRSRATVFEHCRCPPTSIAKQACSPSLSRDRMSKREKECPNKA